MKICQIISPSKHLSLVSQYLLVDNDWWSLVSCFMLLEWKVENYDWVLHTLPGLLETVEAKLTPQHGRPAPLVFWQYMSHVTHHWILSSHEDQYWSTKINKAAPLVEPLQNLFILQSIIKQQYSKIIFLTVVNIFRMRSLWRRSCPSGTSHLPRLLHIIIIIFIIIESLIELLGPSSSFSHRFWTRGMYLSTSFSSKCQHFQTIYLQKYFSGAPFNLKCNFIWFICFHSLIFSRFRIVVSVARTSPMFIACRDTCCVMRSRAAWGGSSVQIVERLSNSSII